MKIITLNSTILEKKVHTFYVKSTVMCIFLRLFKVVLSILFWAFVFFHFIMIFIAFFKSQKCNIDLEMLLANLSSSLSICSYLIPLSVSPQIYKIQMLIKGISGLNEVIQIIWITYWLLRESVNDNYIISMIPSYNLIWSLKMDYE